MRNFKVNTNFDRLQDDELSILAGKIVTAVEEQPLFADIAPTVEAMRVLADDYRQKQEISTRGGSILEKMQKRDSRVLLCKALKVWGQYVNNLADGNVTILGSSGMILSKPPTGPQPPELVRMVRLKDGPLSGQILTNFAPQRGVFSYEVQVGEIPEGQDTIQWQEAITTSSSRNVLLDGLTAGRNYYVRVRARNRVGLGDWSQPVFMMVR